MIAYISGHLDLTDDEFHEHYVPGILAHFGDCSPCFVIGDARGADMMAQQYIADKGFARYITVYHMLDKPRFCVTEATHIGGFISDESRDYAMTLASDYDISWVRPGRETSGTAKNLARRDKYVTRFAVPHLSMNEKSLYTSVEVDDGQELIWTRDSNNDVIGYTIINPKLVEGKNHILDDGIVWNLDDRQITNEENTIS